MELSSEMIRERFKGRGLKSTPQRTAIYKALAETASHPTADDLYRQVSKAYPMISQNTVYYTLAVLRDAGLVQEVNFWHDRARFDANISPHHHLICLTCRSISDLSDNGLNQLSSPADIPSDFQVLGHQVEFRGFCGACRQRKNYHETRSSSGNSRPTTKRRKV
jgi:Fur family peroxide stress response transcriptional regulator